MPQLSVVWLEDQYKLLGLDLCLSVYIGVGSGNGAKILGDEGTPNPIGFIREGRDGIANS